MATLESLETLIIAQGELINALYQAHFYRRVWDKVDSTITIYDEDGITPLYAFDTNTDMSVITPAGLVVETLSILENTGADYTISLNFVDASGATYAITNTFLDADGTGYDLI
jgi:hypothetical protein